MTTCQTWWFSASTLVQRTAFILFLYPRNKTWHGVTRNGIWTSKSGPNMSEPGVFCTFWLRHVLRATMACTFSTGQLLKVLRTWTLSILCILTWKCASRHNGVCFFDISTSKSGPNMVCFVHFDSRATMACTFSTSQLPKVVRTWGVLYILTCKCASRHNGVQFFISHLASWLRARRFSEPTFRSPGPQMTGKHSVSRLPYLFAYLDRLSSEAFFFVIFFLLLFASLLFSSLTLLISAFHLSILSEVWLLNFPR